MGARELSGRALGGPAPTEGDQDAAGDSADYFRIDIDRVVLVEIGDPADHLLITIWTEGDGLVTVRR